MKDCKKCGHSPHLHDSEGLQMTNCLKMVNRVRCKCKEFK